MKVLIVDDENDLREVLALEFEIMGHEVSGADSGQQALKRVQEDRFDVVLCDLRMPKGDGFEFLAELNKLPGKKPPVILMTGLFDFDSRELIARGAFGVVSKPFDWPAIRELLSRIQDAQPE